MLCFFCQLVLCDASHCEILFTSCLGFVLWLQYNRFLCCYVTGTCSVEMLWRLVCPFQTEEWVHVFFGFDTTIVRCSCGTVWFSRLEFWKVSCAIPRSRLFNNNRVVRLPFSKRSGCLKITHALQY